MGRLGKVACELHHSMRCRSSPSGRSQRRVSAAGHDLRARDRWPSRSTSIPTSPTMRISVAQEGITDFRTDRDGGCFTGCSAGAMRLGGAQGRARAAASLTSVVTKLRLGRCGGRAAQEPHMTSRQTQPSHAFALFGRGTRTITRAARLALRERFHIRGSRQPRPISTRFAVLLHRPDGSSRPHKTCVIMISARSAAQFGGPGACTFPASAGSQESA
jgi:hypothetical protein